MNLDPNFKEFVRLLNKRGVEYLIVGGYAVVLQLHYMESLKANKRVVGRPKDLDDLENLSSE